jgi:hypothetical protein
MTTVKVIDFIIGHAWAILLIILAVFMWSYRYVMKMIRREKALCAYWDLRDAIRDHFDKDDLSEAEWRTYLGQCHRVDNEYAITHPGEEFIPLEEVVRDIIGGGDSFAEKEVPVPV